MAWITRRKRSDGGVSATVVWRHRGDREGRYQAETFSAGSDAQNLARADGFKKMVEAAGQDWPDGWVKGEGFVRPPESEEPLKRAPRFREIGEEYVRQIVDLSPRQRKRYLSALRTLESVEIGGKRIFARPVTDITDADLRVWLIGP